MNTLPIVYENDEIYIINKPTGLATQGGKGIVHSVDTVLANQVGSKIYLVHRLDKDTEGLLIVAKTSSAASIWTERISEKEIIKEYLALCSGTFSELKGHITDSIEHKGKIKVALTHYEVEKTLSYSYMTEEGIKEGTLSAVRIKLGTGRMHQIRIHLAKTDHPIVADDKYGNFALNKILKKHCGIKKLHLCAIQLSIPKKYIEDTNSDELFTINIPLPKYIQKTFHISP